MTDTEDPRNTDKNALLGYIEHSVQCGIEELSALGARQELKKLTKANIDELADLGGCDELWNIWDHLMDRIIVSERATVKVDAQ